MNEKETVGVMDLKEADSINEQHRMDIIEKFLEYQIILLNKFKDENKTIDEYLEHLKMTLWHIKENRAQQFQNELGL